MSLFPRSYYASEPSFTPLFRLLDQFDNHYTGGSGSGKQSLMSFQPKFDLKENETNYELHGELPGVAQKDINIEFTDAQTLTVHGRTERHYESGTPPAGFIEGSSGTKSIENGKHQPTVEDVPEGKSSNNEVTKKTEEPKKETSKYWVSERSVGEFSRSFGFPGHVDQDGVKASMKDGILTVIVPKAKKPIGRKIAIE
ncbi:hypothetical protein HYFRA_00013843 [Hymenoscyphus fraxineus]|uniref:SHSP domain-containing protein n=1 Tax=Hymenoscyphus fraxineus TaxID=746836 RepID=A0A9N9PZV6_9HELO|nr:hypothetical protein HYFRA_00013843 [Hymenoscyphus fraxineus]